MYLTITQIALIFYSQQGFLYTLMRSLFNLFFQRINTSSQYNQTLWAAVCEPGFPLPGWICFSNTNPERSPDWSGGTWVGCHIPLTRCHDTLTDLHKVSLIFLPLMIFLQYSTAPESHARFSPKHSSIFRPLVHSASYSTLFLLCSRRGFQDIFLTIFLSWDSSISLPLPLPLPNHSEIYSLVDIDFLLSSILLSGFLFFLSYHLQIASFLSFAMLEILSWKRDFSFFFF